MQLKRSCHRCGGQSCVIRLQQFPDRTRSDPKLHVKVPSSPHQREKTPKHNQEEITIKKELLLLGLQPAAIAVICTNQGQPSPVCWNYLSH